MLEHFNFSLLSARVLMLIAFTHIPAWVFPEICSYIFYLIDLSIKCHGWSPISPQVSCSWMFSASLWLLTLLSTCPFILGLLLVSMTLCSFVLQFQWIALLCFPAGSPPSCYGQTVFIKANILAFCSSSFTLIPSSPLQWISLNIDSNCQLQCFSMKRQYLNSNCQRSIFSWIISQWHLKFTFFSVQWKFTSSYYLLISH